jgi:hypothetical protein
VSGQWSGGAANRAWHRGYQHNGDEVREVRRVLAAFRAANGWQPGMTWNPCTASYEWSDQSEVLR